MALSFRCEAADIAELMHDALEEATRILRGRDGRGTAIEPSSLCMEITESVLLKESEGISETIRRVAGLGVRFVLDDFGTGYSSLAYLTRLPIEVIAEGVETELQIARPGLRARPGLLLPPTHHRAGGLGAAEGTAYPR
ncbi:MAG: EAL domain-containing protein [Solirubrobacteraceae bacterium]|jgi:EAL domain-containing protein (putative c-di-GMP-specific phosphodiesterase class I)